jgi:flavodoxin
MKSLVACYSNSGTTKVVAEQIAAQLGADLEIIEERTPRPRLMVDDQKPAAGGGALARAAMSAFMGIGCALTPSQRDLDVYDLVVVGTPVWAGSVTPAVRSYLKRHRKALKCVAFLCTCGDPTKGRVFSQMRRVSGKAPVATLAVKSEDVRAGTCAASIDSFVSSLTMAR